MKTVVMHFLILLSLALPSCTQQEQEYTEAAPQADLMQLPPPTAQKAAAQAAAQPPQQVPEPVTGRKIIKEGTITFETNDITETARRIARAVQAHNGYITEDSQSDYDTRVEHRVTLRVPASQFDSLLSAIARGADLVKSKNINAQDVTEEYIDVEARLKTKRELEDRYRQLLQRATKVEEILAIEREIGTLRSDIESIEGRLRYLKDRVAYSTLTVIYYQTAAPASGFGYRLVAALGTGWTWLLEFLLGLVSLWPFVLLGGALLLALRAWRHRSKAA